jgi:hypothetical protein
MNTKPRLTKQGLRDLNYYGPKPSKAPATSKPAGPDQERSAAASDVPPKPDVRAPLGA